MAGYIANSKAYIKKMKQRRKEWEILRALLYEGLDLEGCSLIMEQSITYLRVLIDEYLPIELESLY